MALPTAMRLSDIEAKFNELDALKQTLMSRCEQYAAWTLPSVFLPNGTPHTTELQHDMQSVGARAVNHLSNKITLALFRPSQPFFRLEIEPDFMAELIDAGMTEAIVQLALSRAEKKALKKLAKRGSRSALTNTTKALIVTGNSLLFLPPSDGNMQVYSLRDYVTQRDLSGKVMTIITRDSKALETLPVDVRAQLRIDKPELKDSDNVDLYTKVELQPNGKYFVTQAANGIELVGTITVKSSTGTDVLVRGVYTNKNLPWIALTWNLPRGWSYGIGLVEDYAGDFHAMSTLSEAMVVGAAIAADLKFLVDPAGATDVKELNKAKSGSYVSGRKDDIHALQVDKANDWNIVLQVIQSYEKRIGLAFLLGSAVTRDAERVTAEEIRYQAQELETSLGGVYSRLAEELQLPLANLLLDDIDIGDKGKIDAVVLTGLESLSRNSELENIMLFLGDLNQISTLAEEVLKRIKIPDIMAYIGSARGVDYERFMKDEKTVSDEDKQRQDQAMQMQEQVDQSKASAGMAKGVVQNAG